MHADYAEEIATLKRHLAENPDSMLFARMAERYLQMDEIQQAIGICEQGLDHHPNYASGYFVLAKCYYKQQQFDEAERRLKKTIFLDPKFLMAHKLYGDLMTKIGWQKSSESSYRKILEIDPLDENIKNLLSSIPKGEPAAEPTEPLIAAPSESTSPSFDSVMDEPEKVALFDESTLMTAEPAAEPPVERDSAVAQTLFEEDSFVSSPLEEEDLLSEADEPAASKYSPEGFAQEEMRFSEILDDLFSANIVAEERKEAEMRSALEKAAEAEAAGYETNEPEAAKETLLEQREELAAEEDILDATKIFIPDTDEEETFSAGKEPVSDAEAREDTTLDKAEALPEEVREEEPTVSSLPKTEEIVQEPPELAPAELEEATSTEKDTFVQGTGEESFDIPDFDAIPENDLEDQTDDFSNFLSTLGEKEILEEKFDSKQEKVEEQPEPRSFTEAEEEPPFTQLSAESEEEDKMMPGTHVDLTRPKEKFVTPTLGEIYAAQGQYAKAINVFELLLKKHPDNEWYKTKLDHLKQRLAEENN